MFGGPKEGTIMLPLWSTTNWVMAESCCWMRKNAPIFFFCTFSFCFVPVIYTPTRDHCYYCSIVLDTDRPVLSLKLPLLHSDRSMRKNAPFFFYFYVS